MSYTREQSAGNNLPAKQNEFSNPRVIIEEAPAGSASSTSAPRRFTWSLKSVKGGKMEQIALFVIAGVALIVFLLLAGRILPPLFGGAITAFYIALFVGLLTLANLRGPANWTNNLMGRQVFPVIQASSGQIFRIAAVNASLVFVFTFFFHLLAAFITPMFAGIVVFGGLIVLAVFYNRARSVIRKP